MFYQKMSGLLLTILEHERPNTIVTVGLYFFFHESQLQFRIMNRNKNLREEFFFRQIYSKKTIIKDHNRGVRMDPPLPGPRPPAPGQRPTAPGPPNRQIFGKLPDRNAINIKWWIPPWYFARKALTPTGFFGRNMSYPLTGFSTVCIYDHHPSLLVFVVGQ